ncbi:hypothetical protein ACQ7JO_004588 [Vibrio parahaemolyticus]
MKHELKDIKMLMDAGSLKSATVSPLFGGWSATFTAAKGKETYTMHTQRGEVRTFKTLDAACKVIKELGFGTFEVKTH